MSAVAVPVTLGSSSSRSGQHAGARRLFCGQLRKSTSTASGLPGPASLPWPTGAQPAS